MLISCNDFYVANCTNTLCSGNVLVSVNSNINGPSVNIFNKTFNFSVYSSSRLAYDIRKYKKKLIGTQRPRGGSNSDNMNILSFLLYFCFLLIF